MSQLDKSRHSSICGMGTEQFYRQDGKLFDMVTLEEVDPTKIPKSTKEISSICKFCGAKRETAEMMHEHLVARHGAQIAKDKAETEAKSESEEKTERQEPKGKPGRPKKKEITENA